MPASRSCRALRQVLADRVLAEATGRGFDNAVVPDCNGNVAELATTSIWIGKDGIARTPVANSTFLAGITRVETRNMQPGPIYRRARELYFDWALGGAERKAKRA